MTTMTIPSVHESSARVVVEPIVPVRQVVPVRRPRRPVGTPRPADCGDSAGPSLAGGGLTRRGRLVVTLIWVALVAAAALAVVRAQPAPESTAATMTVEVRPGDTLWSLATEFAPSVEPSATVAAIVELNGLGAGVDIAPGDVLEIPTD